MKEIKQIKIEDCVECYVSDTGEPTTKHAKVFIVGQSPNNLYVDNFTNRWKYAIPCEELDNPPKPKWSDKYPKEWSIHAKVFKAISDGAVTRNKHTKTVKSYWYNSFDIKHEQICTNYTGTDSDVWEEIE